MKTWKRCMITHEVQNIRPLNHSMFTTMLKKRENKRVSLDITIEHLLNITCYTPTCVSVMLSVLMPQADLESAVENMLELDDTVLVLVKHHYICLGKKWNAQTLAVTNVRKTVIADEDGSREWDTPPQTAPALRVKLESVASLAVRRTLKLPVVIVSVTVIIRVDGQDMCTCVPLSFAGCDLLIYSNWMMVEKKNMKPNGCCMEALIITHTVFI